MDQRFIDILKNIGELSDNVVVSADSRLQEDIGIDSLKLIDIVLQLEGEFGVSLSEDALAQAKTVGDLWRAVAVTSQ
jgi:acyl carrier protein